MKELKYDLYQEHKICFSYLIAKVISTYYRYFGSEPGISYKEIYTECLKKYKYNKKEQEEIFQIVDNILNEEHNLLVANRNKLYLVDLTEGEK